MAYDITFAESVADQLDFLTAAERRTVLSAIDTELSHEPTSETRNRKPLRPNPLAPWELRVGTIRVFYQVVSNPPVVQVLAIGRKIRNSLRVAGKEIVL